MTGSRGNPSRKRTDATKAEELRRCWDLRVAGNSEREIAAATGIALTTVHRRLVEAFESYVSPARDEIRAYEDARLDRMLCVATEIAQTSDDDEVRLKAVDRVTKLSERRASMHGVDAPTRTVAVNTDLPFDPATEYGQMFAEELAAARAEHRPEGDSDAATA